MTPKTRASAEGKRKRDEKVEDKPKNEDADRDEPKEEVEEHGDQPKAEETKDEDVKEEVKVEEKKDTTEGKPNAMCHRDRAHRQNHPLKPARLHLQSIGSFPTKRSISPIQK